MGHHLNHRVATPVVVEGLADSRNMPQVNQQEPGKRLHPGLPWKAPPKLRTEITQGGASVKGKHPGVAKGRGSAGNVEFIFQFAHNLLQCVLRSHNPYRGPELVYDNRNLTAALLELLQEFRSQLRLGDHGNLSHYLAE